MKIIKFIKKFYKSLCYFKIIPKYLSDVIE